MAAMQNLYTLIALPSSNAWLEYSGFDLTRKSIFCLKWENYFPTWERASCRMRAAHFWHQIKSLKTFPFVYLICLRRIINHSSCFIMNAISSEKRCPTSMAFWHQADWNTFAAVSRSTTWSRASQKFKLLFPEGVSEFCSLQGQELVSFDPWHVIRSPPNGKHIWVGGITKILDRFLESWVWDA